MHACIFLTFVIDLTDTEVVDPNVAANNDTPFAFVDNSGSLEFVGDQSIQTIFPGEEGDRPVRLAYSVIVIE